MAKVVTDDTNYKNIADLIRACLVELGLGTEEEVNEIVRIQPRDMPENLRLLHQFIAYAEFSRGEKSEYDRFWDAYQQNGNLKSYDNAFAESSSGLRWVYGESYNPKYPVKPATASLMYYATRLPYEALKDVDFSDCTDFYQTFAYSGAQHLGVIDMGKATRTTSAFNGSKSLHTIDKIAVSSITPFASTFDGVTGLVNLTVDGTIGQNGFNTSAATLLSKSSIESVINALSTTTSGLSVTISNAAVNTAFTAEEWAALAGIKTNWTINLM